jgi:D-beta-D-heptose 7-phosphate kinase/D-beta-D-heptose 1-phosphate adenosyltransferase
VKPILIIGDSCKDIFVYCRCERLCPEAPVPVLDILETKENGGMAMNVYANLTKLKPEAAIITNSNWESITKTRYVDTVTNQMFVRIDNIRVQQDIFKIKRDTIKFNEFSAIIISDYDKGFLKEDDIEFISNKHKLTFLDTKKKIDTWAKEIAFIKINRKEYALSQDFFNSNKKIKNKVIKTIGEEGTEYLGIKYGVKKVEVKDLSGAGDTFIASLVSKYLDTKDIIKAIEYANKCSTIVVQKKGVTTL